MVYLASKFRFNAMVVFRNRILISMCSKSSTRMGHGIHILLQTHCRHLSNRPFSYSTKEPGSSVIFIHFYTRGSIEWRLGLVSVLCTFENPTICNGISFDPDSFLEWLKGLFFALKYEWLYETKFSHLRYPLTDRLTFLFWIPVSPRNV